MADRESQLVEVVDESGSSTGSCTVAEAHTAPGKLHRAFSVVLCNDLGHILLQRRAAVKTRFALRWANACCGHPGPGESVIDAASARLSEEIGVEDVPLSEAGVYVYRAEDPETGRVEYEYDHVVVGRLPTGASPHPSPGEVADVQLVTSEFLRADLTDHPAVYAPWLSGVLTVASEAGCLPESVALTHS